MKRYWIVGVLALAVTLNAGRVAAQTSPRSSNDPARLCAVAWTGLTPGTGAQADAQARSGQGLSRGAKVAIGTGVGTGVGLLVGEYVFGQAMDMAHGPDMVLGAGIGAGAGALIAWLATKPESGPKSNTAVSILFTPSRKGVVVAFSLR